MAYPACVSAAPWSASFCTSPPWRGRTRLQEESADRWGYIWAARCCSIECTWPHSLGRRQKRGCFAQHLILRDHPFPSSWDRAVFAMEAGQVTCSLVAARSHMSNMSGVDRAVAGVPQCHSCHLARHPRPWAVQPGEMISFVIIFFRDEETRGIINILTAVQVQDVSISGTISLHLKLGAPASGCRRSCCNRFTPNLLFVITWSGGGRLGSCYVHVL